MSYAVTTSESSSVYTRTTAFIALSWDFPTHSPVLIIQIRES